MRGIWHRDEAGQSSMVEVTATLMLLSIVMSFVYAGIDSSRKSITGEIERTSNLSEAQTLMDAITKDLRTATRLQAGTAPFVAADDRDVTFYANLNDATGGPRKIRVYVDPTSEIISAVWQPDAGTISPNYTYTGASALRYVGRYVTNTNLQPIFEYYDVNGVKLTTPLNATALLATYSVKITLIVRKQTTLPVRAVTLVNQVRLPNVDYQPTG